MKQETKPLLFEIGTEELPTKAVKALSTALCDLIANELVNYNLSYKSITPFATPRRIACLITELQSKQNDYLEEKRGPALKAAFDQEHNFTKAAIGFAHSCGTSPDKLEKLETDKGSWLIFKSKVVGKKTESLLSEIITNAVNKLPIAKPMKWGSNDYSFIRPVHWIVLLFGDKKVKLNLFGLNADNKTYGHRFLAPKAIVLKNTADYEKKLHKAFVIANFEKRSENIHNQINKLAEKNKLTALINQDLLEEVTSLVEWPVALLGEFDANFLAVPQECLITSMAVNQKYFPVVDKKNKLQQYFIFISNIASTNKKQVIMGNQRVLSARLKDAEFFYESDKKESLEARVKLLDTVTYQQKLGSLLDKSKRVEKLALGICSFLSHAHQLKNKSPIRTDILSRSSTLAKADLYTAMVYEFPDLQGIMGKYYALLDGEDKLTADIIEQHYLPKFSGDILPESTEACCLALADKLDTIVGIFAINQKPTGDKDPFGLRRAALGVLRILIEKELSLDLNTLINHALDNFNNLSLSDLQKNTINQECLQFCFERLKKYYSDQNISLNLFYAVNNTKTTSPFDFNQRIIAVSNFLKLPEASDLIAANKRVKNILNKQNTNNLSAHINPEYLKDPAEINLNKILNITYAELQPMFLNQDYNKILFNLAKLQKPIDTFFDKVMVNSEDVNLKNNRLVLLKNIQSLFNQAADISELQ